MQDLGRDPGPHVWSLRLGDHGGAGPWSCTLMFQANRRKIQLDKHSPPPRRGAGGRKEEHFRTLALIILNCPFGYRGYGRPLPASFFELRRDESRSAVTGRGLAMTTGVAG